MKCFNCNNNSKNYKLHECEHCGAVLNGTKSNFIAYIGPYGNLAGYNKSYKILLLKYIFECLEDDYTANVNIVISKIKDFYLKRAEKGLLPDYRADIRIANIKESSLPDVFAVIKSQPFYVINQKGFLFLNKKDDELVFTFHPGLINSFTENEKEKLINILDSKLVAYYNKYDKAPINSSDPQSIEDTPFIEPSVPENTSSKLSIVSTTKISDISELSVRAKNILGRNSIFTIEQLVEAHSKTDMMSFRNMGAKTYDEIVQFMDDTLLVPASMGEAPQNEHLKDDNLEDASNSIYSMLVADIPDFSTRTKNALYRSSIHTVLDLIKFGDYSSIRNLGAKSITEINQFLSSMSDLSPIDDNKELDISIHPDNYNLSINMLLFIGVSEATINILHNRNIVNISDIRNITYKDLTALFPRGIAGSLLNSFEKLSEPIIEFVDEYFSNVSELDAYNIYISRANGASLQEIATATDRSRERIRQIEAKFRQKIMPGVSAIIQDQYYKNKTSFVKIPDLKNSYSEDICNIVKHSLDLTKSIQYLPFADIYVESTQDVELDLHRIAKEFVGDGVLFLDHINDLELLLSEYGYDYITADEFLDFLIDNNAYFYGDLITLDRKSYAFICVEIVKKYFPDGISLHDDEDLNLLREYVKRDYGNVELPNNNRALSSRMYEFLVLCDRGKATTIDNISFDPFSIETIKEYIDNYPLKEIYYRALFGEFEGLLTFTSNITNYHCLHGVLQYLYPNDYDFSRDKLTKKDSAAISLRIDERILNCLNEKGHAMSKSDIKATVGTMSDSMIFNAFLNNPKLILWEHNYYNSIDNIVITNEEKLLIKQAIEKRFEILPGYCSDRALFNDLSTSLKEFFVRNNIRIPSNLFYIIENIFRDEYLFSRPHICIKSFKKDITTKEIALHLLGNPKIKNYNDYINLAEKAVWAQGTLYATFTDIIENHIRISEDDYLPFEDFDISQDCLWEIKDILQEEFSDNAMISLINMDDFSEYPEIHYEWNSFLLAGIVENFDIGFKTISHDIKDKRYNRKIIVYSDNPADSLPELVWNLLSDMSTYELSESELLSFLLINELTISSIPYEIQISKKFIFSNGMVRLVK